MSPNAPGLVQKYGAVDDVPPPAIPSESAESETSPLPRRTPDSSPSRDDAGDDDSDLLRSAGDWGGDDSSPRHDHGESSDAESSSRSPDSFRGALTDTAAVVLTGVQDVIANGGAVTDLSVDDDGSSIDVSVSVQKSRSDSRHNQDDAEPARFDA